MRQSQTGKKIYIRLTQRVEMDGLLWPIKAGIDRQRPQVRRASRIYGGALFKRKPGDRPQPAQMVAAPLLD